MHEFLEKVTKTLAYFINKALIRTRSLRYLVHEVKLNSPLFVIGCSRAGTTLVYKTFSESKHLGSLHKETHDFWAAMHPLKERNWDTHTIPEEMACEQDRKIVERYFYSQTGRTRIVDKNNQNGLSVPYLYQLFPDAHFIYIKRNPGDNINSLMQGWNKADEFATWSNELSEDISIEQGKNKRWCFFLAKGWRRYTQGNIEDVCAFQYMAMNEAILHAKSLIPECQWHELSYEILIADPVNEFAKVFADCHVHFGEHLQRHCEEVLQKPYNTFSEIRVNKWKDHKNKEKIERIFPLVKSVAEKMGY